MLSWKNPGFSLHKEVCIRGGDRAGLERLLYYCARPALSLARLVYSAKGNMVLYRTEMREGRARLLAMTPVEFLRRWGLLMPPPHKNLIHYYLPAGRQAARWGPAPRCARFSPKKPPPPRLGRG